MLRGQKERRTEPVRELDDDVEERVPPRFVLLQRFLHFAAATAAAVDKGVDRKLDDDLVGPENFELRLGERLAAEREDARACAAGLSQIYVTFGDGQPRPFVVGGRGKGDAPLARQPRQAPSASHGTRTVSASAARRRPRH